MKKKVDRDKVARLAGVSSATVSRVFNHPEKVSREKRETVLEAAEKLNYKPNLNAAILAKGIHGRILLLDNNKLLKYDRSNSYYYSWLYVDLLNQIRDVLKNTMYELIISNLEDLRTQESKDLKDFDGIICFDIDTMEDLDPVIKSGVPYVFGHHVRDMPLVERIYTDNYYGGYLQARFLKETGHERSIYITGLMDQLNAHKERFDGFREVYTDKNIHVINGIIGKDGGCASALSALDLIRSGEYRSIAVVNDLTAIGVYFELMNKGIRIPEDVSLIGYDNLPFTNLLPRRLSTIDIKIGQLYRQAAEQLLNIIEGKRSDLNRSYKPDLVRGRTVADRT
ncbi:LacI family DNA-binding transcriptional regulator [Spirochaeta isovalerica]|uniref:DNA-binding LacI/PurR family transcriptional regulator n=1 Tax=Spirochaeta isovalerica TaxID=150 RepID=A0A841R5L3_9SPIO|nr:LacI family DNA-binding transcriptional regulator [Spirochaeta isovalerica]MBB6479145.1 DNA-binding LacI/PurR family transcriptional regulator [Spirochaeta isovalerica]